LKRIIARVEGGLGKNIMFTSLLRKLKDKYLDGVHLTTSYPPVFMNNDLVTSLNQFEKLNYKEIKEDPETFICFEEPYSDKSFLKKESHLIDIWSRLLDLENLENGMDSSPELFFSEEDKKQFEILYNTIRFQINDNPFILIQLTGGQSPISYDQGGGNSIYNYSREDLQRAYPMHLTVKLIKELKKAFPRHVLMRYGLPNEIVPFDVKDYIYSPPDMGYKYFSLLAERAYKVITIDSSLQHLAAAVKVPSYVIWGETSPKIFGYSIHANIIENQKESCSYWNTVGTYNNNINFPSVEKIMSIIKT
jgi:hypothetical protein